MKVKISNGPTELSEQSEAIFHSRDPEFNTVPVWIGDIDKREDGRYAATGSAFQGTPEEGLVSITYSAKSRTGTMEFLNVFPYI